MGVIGIDVGGSKIRAGLVRDGVLQRVVETRTLDQGSQEDVVAQIFQLIEQLGMEAVEAIGIGVPAIVDLDQGMVFETAQIPSWRRVPLRALVEKRFSLPTWVNNDSNCFAMAEHCFGAGRGYRDMAAVTLGSGLGIGLVLDARLHAGHNCGAGEFGRMLYRDRRLTDYCSGKFFLREYAIPGTLLHTRAGQGDRSALKAFERFGWHLGKGLSLLVHAVDPEIIVLGGGIARAGGYFRESMMASLEESIYERSFSRLRVVFSQLQDDSAVLGAAALAWPGKADCEG
jgi:glucokinase